MLYNIRLVHIWRLVSHHVLAFIRLQVVCNTYITVASYDTGAVQDMLFQRSSCRIHTQFCRTFGRLDFCEDLHAATSHFFGHLRECCLQHARIQDIVFSNQRRSASRPNKWTWALKYLESHVRRGNRTIALGRSRRTVCIGRTNCASSRRAYNTTPKQTNNKVFP